LIPDGENEHVLWATRSLAQSGVVDIHILSAKRWPPVRFSRHCRLYEFKPLGTDHRSRLAAVTDIIKRTHVDVLLPVSEEGVSFAISERETLTGLVALPPLPDLDAFNTARDKWLLNQFACRHRLPAPPSLLVVFDAVFEQALASLEYPVLLKPTRSTDGLGIRRFDSRDALWRFLQGQDRAAFAGNYLVQSFVPGFDLGFSALCHEGRMLAFTMQRGVISAAHRFGPLMAMEFIREEDVLEIGRRLLAALRWGGVAHVDLRRDSRDGQAKILEINARYWGSLLGSLVAGVNFPYLACLAAQGQVFPVPTYQLKTYMHTTTALKEGLLGMVGKSTLPQLNLRQSGLKFFVADPLPEIVKRFQEISNPSN
jgi:predicted ATP-grasp superfamily ATP-dependent carboligase